MNFVKSLSAVSFNAILTKEIRFINWVGRPRNIVYGDMLRMAIHPSTLFYLVIVGIILTLLDANGYQANLPLWGGAVVWFVGILVATLSYSALLFLWTAFYTKTSGRGIAFPVIAFLSTLSTLYGAELTESLLLGQPFSGDHWARSLPYTFLVITVFDIVHFVFAMPVIQAKSRHEAEPEKRPPITLAGRTFKRGTIHWAMSQDHYLKISTGDKTEMVLARMADLADQTDPEEGLQPHRSWWIAPHAIKALKDSGGVLMKDGTVVPVARGRLSGLRAWLKSSGCAEKP